MEDVTEQANELISLARSERAAQLFDVEPFDYQADCSTPKRRSRLR